MERLRAAARVLTGCDDAAAPPPGDNEDCVTEL